MKIKKRIILILLLLALFAGSVLLNPCVRFAYCLRADRIEDAQAIYLSKLYTNGYLDKEASSQLLIYVEHLTNSYFSREISFKQITSILKRLSKGSFPQDDIERYTHEVNEMEVARNNFEEATRFYEEGNFKLAIPLYRSSLISDSSATLLLQQSETGFKNQVLDESEKAMISEDYEAAERLLLEGLSILDTDEDLSAALMDTRRMKADKEYGEIMARAREYLLEKGPEVSFEYINNLRQQSPDDYELDYLEQILLHEYEDDICSQALSLQQSGNLDKACSLLEEGLKWIDSDTLKKLFNEIRSLIPFQLEEMDILYDDTANARTGADSTIVRDHVLVDSFSNEYTHSFAADLGSVTFFLNRSFSTFTGTVAFPGGEKSDIYRSSATLQVFGDDKLIAEFKDFDQSSAPIPFSIPVNEISYLSLFWTCAGANGWKDWGHFATIFDAKLIAVSQTH